MESQSPLPGQARALAEAGRWREARALLERLADAPGCDPAVVRQLAEIEIVAGDSARAMERLERLPGGDDETEFLKARAEEGLGRIAPARDRLLRLRSRAARASPVLELQLGLLHQRLGDTAQAIASMREAIRLDPRFIAARQHLAGVISLAGTREEARAALDAAIAGAPDDPGLWTWLAQAQTRAGDAAAAIASLDRALAAHPGDAATWTHIGELFLEHARLAQADAALANASRLDPGSADIEPTRAMVKQELGDNEGALRALAAAARRDPDDLRVAIAERLFLPQSYSSLDDVARWRARYTHGVQALVADSARLMPRAAEVFRVERSNFFLAYQGEDDHALQEAYSGLLARFAGAADGALRERPAATYDGNRRLRVGFLGNVFRDSTAGRYFERWITGLDRARFETSIYHTAPVADALTQRVAAAADHFHDERLDTHAMARMVRSHALDVLVYPEVGMSSITYLLAALHLAPVQCAGWGHPVTTGSDAIDFYFTCGAMEPPGGQQHYTERLVMLPGIGVDYAMPAAPPPTRRSDFGLPQDGRIYLCAQSLFKVHPEMDDLFARILAEDPQGAVVFFQAPSRAVTEQLAARIQRALVARGIAPRGQVKFLPRMPGAAFRRALAVADVVLDTVRWSGGNTSLDAFAAGAPVVTLEGRFMRGRQTAAMLRMLELPELVAADADDYARIALEAARNRDLNAHMRAAIAQRRGVLFDRHDWAAAFGEALLGLAAGYNLR